MEKIKSNFQTDRAGTHNFDFFCEQGTLLWQRRAAYGFRHNTICLAAGRLYCIDSLSRLALDQAKRRGEEPQKALALRAVLLLAAQKHLDVTSIDVSSPSAPALTLSDGSTLRYPS